jgi:hypothetical protein
MNIQQIQIRKINYILIKINRHIDHQAQLSIVILFPLSI